MKTFECWGVPEGNLYSKGIVCGHGKRCSSHKIEMECRYRESIRGLSRDIMDAGFNIFFFPAASCFFFLSFLSSETGFRAKITSHLPPFSSKKKSKKLAQQPEKK